MGFPRPQLNGPGSDVDTTPAMDIVERREHGGEWWGRDANGSWHRWNTASDDWDEPGVPPWPPSPAPHPDEVAIVAAAMAAGAATARAIGEGPPDPAAADASAPMNRIDTRWNREFPPFSKRRLVFGLVALPVIAALQELLFRAIGWRASLPRFLFVCVAGGVLLSIAFLPGMREMAERLQRAQGSRRTPWPWQRRPPTDPAPPLPPLERRLGHDFLVALPFSITIMLVIGLTVSGPTDTFRPASLLTSGVAALFTAALIALRTSVWGLALFSIAGGLLGGLFLVVLSAMTFSDPSGDFYLGWAIGSMLLFLYAYPMWRWLRDLEARGFRLPMWIVMGGSTLLVCGAALVFVAEH